MYIAVSYELVKTIIEISCMIINSECSLKFYDRRLLGLQRVPLTVGRVIDLEVDILPVATERLRNTFFTNGA